MILWHDASHCVGSWLLPFLDGLMQKDHTAYFSHHRTQQHLQEIPQLPCFISLVSFVHNIIHIRIDLKHLYRELCLPFCY